jgi:DNA repair exonuclease SbcCD ATPase subunit
MAELEDTETARREDQVASPAHLVVDDVGGIDWVDVTFQPGCTVLAGRNATNRTSLLTALADVLGGDQATLKSDADAGRVELELGDRTYERNYERRAGGFHSDGERYTDERHLVELFVALFEDNPIRRGVERGDDLRELLMRPVDTDEIERQVRSLRRRREDIESQVREIESDRERLPALEERRTEYEAELERVEGELADLRAAVEDYEADEKEAERAEEMVEELDSLRERLQETERKLSNRRSELDRLEDERESVEDELADVSVPESELESVTDRLRKRKEERRRVEESVDSLERIVSFNRELLDGDGTHDLFADDGDVTVELDPASKSVECWTCGSEVARADVADRLDELAAVVEEREAERRELDGQISDLEDRKRELERETSRRGRLTDRLDDLERQVELQESEIDDLETERADVRDEIAAVEERVEETEDLRESELVDQYRRLSELEYERGRIEGQLEDVTDEIAALQDRSDELESLREEREAVREEIAALRSRIDDLETDAVEQFNDHMAAVLDVLGYENLERVWIERRAREDDESEFELHVVRETAEGTVYEDVVANLSESERDVVGLVVALAGYLVHDAHETVPFMLLDSLEAIDSDRIAALVEYFESYAPYVVVALLPKDADGLPDEYDRVPASALSR